MQHVSVKNLSKLLITDKFRKISHTHFAIVIDRSLKEGTFFLRVRAYVIGEYLKINPSGVLLS